MPRVIDLGRGEPSLNIASYGRRGPGQRVSLTATEVAQAVRTARGAPEVVVKVSGGASTTKGVRQHLDYIGREGELEIETDDGQLIQKPGFEKQVIENWDLDLEERKGSRRRAITTRAKPPKLVHNVVFSMPAGTPAKKVQAAVRKFAGEKFALQHRYLMALHTDQPQPHVHLVVKAVSEQGVRSTSARRRCANGVATSRRICASWASRRTQPSAPFVVSRPRASLTGSTALGSEAHPRMSAHAPKR